MTVFVDTSAIFAGIDRSDARHRHAAECWAALLDGRADLLTHSLVEVEAAVLLQARLGTQAVARFSDSVLPSLEVVEIDRDRRRSAFSAAAADEKRSLSVVDRVSFDLMGDLGITDAFAYDRHFADAGFDLIGSTA